MTQEQALNNQWIQLGCRQMELYEQNPTAYTSVLVKCQSLRDLMCAVYDNAIYFKLELPLEQLPEPGRRKIWESAKAEGMGKINNEECIKLAKALYTINCFLNQ